MPMSKEKAKSMVKYVRKGTDNIWRANPKFPHIYVSFNTQLLKDTYGSVPGIGFMDDDGLASIIPSVQTKFKSLISQEWVGRAGLPISYLSAAEKNIKNKNVVFIVSYDYTREEYCQKFGAIYANTESVFSNGEVVAKVMRLPKYTNLSQLTNEQIYSFLHESTHAFIGGEHFSRMTVADIPPFTEDLTCTDTVLAYANKCPPVINKGIALFGKGFTVPSCSHDKEMQAKIDYIYDAHPVELGPVDLACAEEFKLDWEARNKAAKANKPKTTASYQSGKIELMEQRVLSDDNSNPSFIDKLIQSAKALTDSCPSYFPVNNTSYWSAGNASVLFAKSNQTNHEVPLLTNVATTKPGF